MPPKKAQATAAQGPDVEKEWTPAYLQRFTKPILAQAALERYSATIDSSAKTKKDEMIRQIVECAGHKSPEAEEEEEKRKTPPPVALPRAAKRTRAKPAPAPPAEERAPTPPPIKLPKATKRKRVATPEPAAEASEAELSEAEEERPAKRRNARATRKGKKPAKPVPQVQESDADDSDSDDAQPHTPKHQRSSMIPSSPPPPPQRPRTGRRTDFPIAHDGSPTPHHDVYAANHQAGPSPVMAPPPLPRRQNIARRPDSQAASPMSDHEDEHTPERDTSPAGPPAPLDIIDTSAVVPPSLPRHHRIGRRSDFPPAHDGSPMPEKQDAFAPEPDLAAVAIHPTPIHAGDTLLHAAPTDAAPRWNPEQLALLSAQIEIAKRALDREGITGPGARTPPPPAALALAPEVAAEAEVQEDVVMEPTDEMLEDYCADQIELTNVQHLAIRQTMDSILSTRSDIQTLTANLEEVRQNNREMGKAAKELKSQGRRLAVERYNPIR